MSRPGVSLRAVPQIVPYNPSWPAEFQGLAADLRRGLGSLALRIDHIGSTSVADLDAKDVIDIQVTVAELSDEIASKIKALGFIQQEGIWRDHCPPGAPDAEEEWSKLLFIQPLDKRRVNLHVRVQGCGNQRYPLLFRDYLRSHPKSAAAYAELKRRLAENLADWDTYPDVKDPAVDLIYFAAEDWATATGWQPSPSDA